MNASVATRQLDIPGASIHYEVRGSGPLLALIAAHGGFADEAPASPSGRARYWLISPTSSTAVLPRLYDDR